MLIVRAGQRLAAAEQFRPLVPLGGGQRRFGDENRTTGFQQIAQIDELLVAVPEARIAASAGRLVKHHLL